MSRDKEDELAGSLRDLQRVADKLEEQTRAIRDFEKRNVSAELAKSVKKCGRERSPQTHQLLHISQIGSSVGFCSGGPRVSAHSSEM